MRPDPGPIGFFDWLNLTESRVCCFLSAKLGPYEILAPTAAGGMGEAYRAKDADVHVHQLFSARTWMAIRRPHSIATGAATASR